jgi:hypothetical protein
MPKITTKTTPKKAAAPKTMTESNTSRIDLSKLTLRELIALRDQVDVALADVFTLPLGEGDAALEYSLVLRTADGTVSRNAGNIQMNKLLHPRLIAESPARFEQQFSQQIYAPLSASLYDLLDKHNPTGNSTYALKQQIGDDYDLPGLPVNISTLPDNLTVQ